MVSPLLLFLIVAIAVVNGQQQFQYPQRGPILRPQAANSARLATQTMPYTGYGSFNPSSTSQIRQSSAMPSTASVLSQQQQYQQQQPVLQQQSFLSPYSNVASVQQPSQQFDVSAILQQSMLQATPGYTSSSQYGSYSAPLPSSSIPYNQPMVQQQPYPLPSAQPVLSQQQQLQQQQVQQQQIQQQQQFGNVGYGYPYARAGEPLPQAITLQNLQSLPLDINLQQPSSLQSWSGWQQMVQPITQVNPSMIAQPIVSNLNDLYSAYPYLQSQSYSSAPVRSVQSPSYGMPATTPTMANPMDNYYYGSINQPVDMPTQSLSSAQDDPFAGVDAVGARGGCPALSDNTQIIKDGATTYTVQFNPTSEGVPLAGLTNVVMLSSIAGQQQPSQRMTAVTPGLWKGVINGNGGQMVTWRFQFNAGTEGCQGMEYAATIPTSATQRIISAAPVTPAIIAAAVQSGEAVVRRPCPIISHTSKVDKLDNAVAGINTPAGSSMYGVTFIANSDLPLQWVDLHYSINGAQPWQTNVRMLQSRGNQQQFEYLFGIPLQSNDQLKYSFTYCSQYNDCDTPIATYSPSTHGQYAQTQPPEAGTMLQLEDGSPSSVRSACPTITFRTDIPAIGASDPSSGTPLYGIMWTAQLGAEVDWVDVHFKVNNGPQLNYKMQSTSPGVYQLTSGIPLKLNDQLNYYFTSSVADIQCDSEPQTFVNKPRSLNGQTLTGTSIPAISTACGNIQYTSQVMPAGSTRDGSPLYELRFRALTGKPVQWADSHWSLVKDASKMQPWQMNERMDNIGDGQFGTDAISMKRGDTLGYAVTFHTSDGTCDTGVDTYSLP